MKSRWRRVIRFRMNNGMRGARYWKAEEKKRCRMCGGDKEIGEHMIRKYKVREDGQS